MQHRRVKAFATVVWLLAWVLPTTAGEYRDPSGFSLSYPEGWVAVTNRNLDTLTPRIRTWFEKNHLDLRQIRLMLLREGQEEPPESLTVGVDSQEVPLDERTLNELIDKMPQHHRSKGLTVENLRGRVETIGTNRAFVFDYQANFPDSKFPMRQRMVIFSGGGNSYFVTFTAKPDTFDNYTGTLNAILASFKVPAPIVRHREPGFDWDRVLTFTLLAAVVGIMIGLIRAVIRKKKPK